MITQYPNFGAAIIRLRDVLEASKTIREEHLLNDYIDNSEHIFEPIVRAAVGQFLNEVAILALSYLEDNSNKECEEEMNYS